VFDGMSHHPLLNEHILKLIPSQLDNKSILDVGCGYGEWGFLIRTRKQGSPFLIGLDIWMPYLKRLNSLTVYDLLIRAALPYIPLRQKSVNISLACEILEHLHKKMVIC
jgi:SAM-dependent methyltransferase